MADLSNLYKVAPITAAGMTGSQQAMDDQTQGLDQQKLQQLIQSLQIQNQQSQVMNPLLAQHQGLQNDSLSAQIPGQQATSQTLQQTANIGQQTLGSTIARKNAENDEATASAGFKSADEFTHYLTNQAARLDQVPAPARAGAINDIIKQAGSNPADPKIAPLVAQLQQNPDKIPDFLRLMAKGVAQQTPAYQQHMDGVNAEVAGREKVGAGNNAATVEAARIAAASRVESATIRKKEIVTEDQSIDNAKSARERYQKLTDAATKAVQAGDTERAQNLMVRAENIRPQAEAEINNLNPKPGTPDIGRLANIPTNPTQSIRPQGQGGGAPANPLAGGVGDFSDQAKQAWGAYEPQKYEYRVGPNGVLQRKPKGK